MIIHETSLHKAVVGTRNPRCRSSVWAFTTQGNTGGIVLWTQQRGIDVAYSRNIEGARTWECELVRVGQF
jgi:hypothetical protein